MDAIRDAVRRVIENMLDEIVEQLGDLPDCPEKRDLSQRVNLLEENLMSLDQQ